MAVKDLQECLGMLEKHRDELVAKNDAFAVTRYFLEGRGLKSTSELDAEGRKALLEYLHKTLKDSLKAK